MKPWFGLSHCVRSFDKWFFRLSLLGTAMLSVWSVVAQVPDRISREDLEQLRRKLDELELRRITPPEEELPWEMDATPDIGEVKPYAALVRIASESYKLGCVWVVRRLDDPRSEAVRACIYHQGKDYLVLPPGDYEVTLHAGRAEDIVISLKPRRVTLRRGSVYRSEFSLDVEDMIARRIKAVLDEDAAVREKESHR